MPDNIDPTIRAIIVKAWCRIELKKARQHGDLDRAKQLSALIEELLWFANGKTDRWPSDSALLEGVPTP